MVNPNIIMGAQQPDTASPINQFSQQQVDNAMNTERILKAHYDGMDAREKSRLSSTIIGAAQLKSFLDNNDVEGAQNFLSQRRSKLQNRMAYGEDIDTQETDYALDAIKNGRVDELKNGINGLMAAGQIYGIIPQSNSAYIQQFNAVKSANPNWNDAQVWDYVYGRGDIGKTQTRDAEGNVINQPGAVNAASEMKSKTEFAGKAGSDAGAQVIKNENTLGNLGNLQQAITAAKTTLPKVKMTGPVYGRVGDAAKDPEYINLMRDLNEITLLAKDLYNLGSGQGFTDADRDFLKELAGGAYNRDESIDYALRRFEEAITNRSKFLNQQNQQYQTQYGTQATATPQQPTAKVRVSNGKETFEIDPADLAAAEAEGFKRQ